jgi:Rrf2 family iron-sulfur cluster assembly transcriptional regulator
MRLSHASSYAVHALAFLAAQGGNQLLPGVVIGQNRDLPGRFLAKLLKQLERAQLVQSRRGPSGGFRLARPPSRISLLEIIEAIDGTIHGDAPFLGDKADQRLRGRLQAICEQAAEQRRARLARVRLSQLIDKGRT